MATHSFLAQVETHTATDKEEGGSELALVASYGDFGEAHFILDPEAAKELFPVSTKLIITVETADE